MYYVHVPQPEPYHGCWYTWVFLEEPLAYSYAKTVLILCHN